MRRVSLAFSVIFVIEFCTLLGLFFWISSAVQEQSQLVGISSGLLISFGSLLLTTSLVYNHFWLHPELKLTNIVVEPLDAQNNQIAEAEFRSPVWARLTGALMRLPDGIVPKEKNGFRLVRSSVPCTKLRISTDVCNVGGSETSMHEYIVKEISPNKRIIGTYAFRKLLPNEKRETIDFSHVAASGEFVFEIKVVASTVKSSRRLKIIVSNNLREIRWREYDC